MPTYAQPSTAQPSTVRPSTVWRLLACVTALAAVLSALLGVGPAEAAVAVADLGAGSSPSDLASYATGTVTPPVDGLLLLAVTSGRSDGTAAAPVSVSGLGATWTQVATARNKPGSLAEAVWSTTSATTTGPVTVTYGAVQQNLTWQVVQAGPATDTVVQSATALASTTTASATLPATPRPGSAVLGFAAALSTVQTLSPGAGFSALGTQQTSTAPVVRSGAEWRPDGVARVGFTGSGSSAKVVVAVEVSDGPFVPAYVAGPTVAVIGDSLTDQGGKGAAALGSRLAAIGYDADHVYFDAVGGKAMAKADSTGMTTVQNVADARARLGHVDTWVIALGTNDVSSTDATFAASQNAILDAIGPSDAVVWIGLAFYRSNNSRTARFDPILAADAAARTTVRFADWNAVVHDGRDETGLWVYPTDSTHMTDAGYALRDDYYVAQVPAVTPAG